MEHQSLIQVRREGRKWTGVCQFIYPPQNLNVYDLLIRKFHQSAALNIMIIRLRMYVTVLYSVHNSIITNGFNNIVFKYSSGEQAKLLSFYFFQYDFV
jgi:hypothetical protein